jgi:ABC-2 type transport system ATP-binding protein
LHRPPIIFLDEPTSGVDPGTRRHFWDLIYDLADQGVTVFVTTHYMEEAEYCNRIGLIDRGQLIALGSPAELKSRHLSGVLYEIETDRVLAAAEALARVQGVLDAAVFGHALHVRLVHGMDAHAYLPAFLNSSGLVVNSIRTIEPSLEDVFVALVGRKGGQPS